MPEASPVRLVRQNHGNHLSFIPAAHCRCGGELEVKDWRTHNASRYECYCTGCHTCDPNGYGSQSQILANCPAFFNPPPTP